MALLNVNLGTQDQTIDTTNATDGDTVAITALGSQTLTIDGVSVGIDSVAGVTADATPTFTLSNGASLDASSGLLNASALGTTTYNVNDTSTLTLGTPAAGAGVLSNTNVNFTGDQSGTLLIDNNAVVGVGSAAPTTINVSGLGYGDHIGFTNPDSTYGGFVATSATGGTLTLSAPAAIGTTTFQFNLTNLDPSVTAALTTNGASLFANGTLTPVCFTRGTMIATPDGEIAVEDLAPGDVVLALGGPCPVKWVGYRFIAPARVPAEHRATMLPVRIRRDALGHALPSRDLVVSPGHHLLIDGQLVKAGALVNGRSIVQETGDARIDYFHVELDRFDVLVSNGVYSESYADGGNRDYFQNVNVARLHPEHCIRRLADRPGFTLMGETVAAALCERLAGDAARIALPPRMAATA